MVNRQEYVEFVRESNKIEGILRDPTDAEVDELIRFVALPQVTIDDLIKFVSIYQPDAQLRDKEGLNVRIGGRVAPLGGPTIREAVDDILVNRCDSLIQHVIYEHIHPFTDGNGRSGRALWAWRRKSVKDSFLHMFYYQSLALLCDTIAPITPAFLGTKSTGIRPDFGPKSKREGH